MYAKASNEPLPHLENNFIVIHYQILDMYLQVTFFKSTLQFSFDILLQMNKMQECTHNFMIIVTHSPRSCPQLPKQIHIPSTACDVSRTTLSSNL